MAARFRDGGGKVRFLRRRGLFLENIKQHAAKVDEYMHHEIAAINKTWDNPVTAIVGHI
jgi:hypothetical protein